MRAFFPTCLALTAICAPVLAQSAAATDVPGVPAQSAVVAIDMASVVKLVQDRNLEVQASREGANTARHKVEQAKALRFGKVGVEASYLRLNDQIEISSPPVYVPLFGGLTLAVPPTVVAPQDLLHVRLEAGLPLFTGGKISNTIAQARAGQRAAEALSGDTEAEVILEAERLYLGVLLSRDVARLNEQALESYRQHLEQARSAHRLGVVAMYDVIRAETAVAEQEKRLTEARNRCQLVEAALRTALDLSEPVAVNIGGTLFEPPPPILLTDAEAAAMRNHSGLQALRHKVEALDRAERAEKGDYLPQILAVAGKETVTNKLAQTDPDWFAGLRASWTLFEGGARRARVAEKASEKARARIELRSAEEKVRLGVRSALLDYESQKSACASARKVVELSRESLRLATKRFGVGTGTSLEVLDANLALTASETGARSSLYYMDLAYLEMHRYTGDIAEVALRVQK
jgi:outer membrane protein